jgi:HK97 family phage portal protein
MDGLINRIARFLGYERRSLAQPSSDLFALLGVHPTASGISVSPETALRSPTVLACVRLLSEVTATLPLLLYRRGPDGSRERDRDHPVARLLAGFWTPWQSAFAARSALMADALLHGEAFAQTVTVNGTPVELHRLPPYSVSVETDDITLEPSYRLHLRAGGDRVLPWSQVVHLVTPGATPDRQLSIVKAAREAIAVDLVMHQHQSRLFGAGARPSGVLEVPGQLSPQAADRLRQSWNSAHSGADNAGKTAILEAGTKFTPLQLTSVDAQLLELRRLAVEDIARAFRLPVTLIGVMERATWRNSEEMSLQFLSYTLLPWLEAWTSALTRVLLAPEEREELFLEFKTEELLKGDIKTRFEAYRLAAGGAWMTRNEIRQAENDPPIDGLDEMILQAGQQAGSGTDAA